MGCGKSSVGRRLSELLCCPFMDLDHVIEESTGRKIPEIFATDGEAAFRAMELEALNRMVPALITSEPRQCAPLAPSHFVGPSPYAGVRECQFHTHALAPTLNHTNLKESCNDVIARSEATWQSVDLVLALGGGTVMTPECAEIVHSQTRCIYLRATVDTLVSHLENEAAGRPILNTGNCHFDQAKRVEKSALRERITSLMARRSATYEKTAHVIIDTDGKSIEAIASEIISKIS